MSNFKSQKDALQVDDKDAGVIAYKTSTSYTKLYKIDKFPFVRTYNISYIIKFLLKDGKAKIIIYDFMVNTRNEMISSTGTRPDINNTYLPLETVVSSYEHPNDSLINSSKLSKKIKEMSKVAFEDQKDTFISTLKDINLNVLTTIESIQEQLTGEVKSEMDF